MKRHLISRALVTSALTLGLTQSLPAAAQDTRPATAVEPASPALVDHLLTQITRREQPPATGLFAAMQSPTSAFEAEQQLRRLGGRASAAAPRVAEMLMRTEKNGYELAWTLASIAPDTAAADLDALRGSIAASSGAERLVQVARIGRARASAALPDLVALARAEDAPARLLAGIGLGYLMQPDLGSQPALTLAAMLQDKERPVRQVAVNGLRLLGARASAAAPALVAYLRTRDNPYMATRAMAALPIVDVAPAKPELEVILADAKLTEYQKQPAVELLMRIENHLSAAAAAQAAPVPMPTPKVASPTRAATTPI